jgi:hypothetical protein
VRSSLVSGPTVPIPAAAPKGLGILETALIQKSRTATLEQTAKSTLLPKLAVRNLALIFRLNYLAARKQGEDFPFDRLGIRYIRKAQIPYRRLS